MKTLDQMTIDELKQAGWDCIQLQKAAANNLRLVEMEIQKRSVPQPVLPVPAMAKEKKKGA